MPTVLDSAPSGAALAPLPADQQEKDHAAASASVESQMTTALLGAGGEGFGTEEAEAEAAAAPEEAAATAPDTDMMDLLDLLAEKKREKDEKGLCDCLARIGKLAFSNQSEREAVCDFDGITAMCEIVREPEVYFSGELTDSEKAFFEAYRKKKLLIAEEEKAGGGASKPKEEPSCGDGLAASLDDYRDPLSLELTPHVTKNSAFDQFYRSVMISFSLSLKGVCNRSNLNRGALRDEGAVEEVVGFVEGSFAGLSDEVEEDEIAGQRGAYFDLLERSAAAGCSALKALCNGNDGNKKLAAKIAGKFNAEGLAATDCLDPTVPTMAKTTEKTGKAIDLLLELLTKFPHSARIQAQGIWALRSIVTDDDSRGGESMVPSAVENRDYVCDSERFPRTREIIVRSFRDLKQNIDDNLAAAGVRAPAVEAAGAAGETERTETLLPKEGDEGANPNPEETTTSAPAAPKSAVFNAEQWYRLEGVLLLMKEVGCHQERIHKFVFEDNVLPLIKDTLSYGHESIVRACLFVLRQFAFSDHMKDLFTTGDADITKTAMLVLRKYSKTTAIVEQAFGLFSNLTLRKPQICEVLNADPMRIAAFGLIILGEYQTNASVVTTVLFTLRNVAKAVPEAASEMEHSGLFELIRKIYFAREQDTTRQWLAAKDIGKQFLREFREDTDGMRRPITHNDYY